MYLGIHVFLVHACMHACIWRSKVNVDVFLITFHFIIEVGPPVKSGLILNWVIEI